MEKVKTSEMFSETFQNKHRDLPNDVEYSKQAKFKFNFDSELAKEFLCCCGSSIPSKWVFSKTRTVESAKRNRLLGKHDSILVFCRIKSMINMIKPLVQENLQAFMVMQTNKDLLVHISNDKIVDDLAKSSNLLKTFLIAFEYTNYTFFLT